MKNLLKIMVLLNLLFIQISCETADNAFQSVNTEKPLSNSFALKNSNQLVSSHQMIAKIRQNANLSTEQDLTNFSLRELNSNEKAKEDINSRLYVLKARTTDGNTSVAHLFKLDEINNILIDLGKTCKCTSTNCGYGCDSHFFGGACSCTHCSNECKKESTTTEDSEPKT